jgi:hypothetical protein
MPEADYPRGVEVSILLFTRPIEDINPFSFIISRTFFIFWGLSITFFNRDLLPLFNIESSVPEDMHE